MSTDSSAPPTPRLIERIGSPATVAALAFLVVVGMGITLVVLVAQSVTTAQDSRRSEDIAHISDSSIALLVALQRERGLAELYLAGSDPEDLTAYEESFAATDQAAEAYADTWSESGVSIRREQQGAISGVAATLTPLSDIRSAVAGGDAEASVDPYSVLVESIRQTLSEMALLTTDAEAVRMRRAVLSLMDASAALATRRAIVAGLLASSEPVTDPIEIQLSLLGRESDVNLRSARALLAADYAERMAELTASAEAGAAEGLLEGILQGPRPEVTPRSWFAVATNQIDLIVDYAIELNDRVRERAVQAIADARRAVILTITLVGALFALSVLAAWSAITASRERARALEEHRDLVDGLRRWFGSEAMPQVDGLEIEVRYAPSATRAGAGGDWYDVFFENESDLALVVGDVSGHGPTGVAHMAEMRNVLRGLAHARVGGPARQLEILDETVESNELTTILYALISPEAGELTYTRAGHVPAVLCHPGGHHELLEAGSDTPIGIGPNQSRTESSVTIKEGDILVLITDGLIEEPGKDLYTSLEELAETVATHDGDLASLADELLARRPANTTGDDASALLVRVSYE